MRANSLRTMDFEPRTNKGVIMLFKKHIFPFAILAVFFFVSSCTAQSDIKALNSKKAGLTVSVYSNNLSLVRDVRGINIPVGMGEMTFDDIPESIIPETVNVTSLTGPEGFDVFRQQYDYDLIAPDKLLDDYVGKKIKIMSFNEYHDRKEIVEAELLSNRGSKVYRIGDEIFLGYPGHIVLPEVPDNFTTKPQLLWAYDNNNTGDQKIEVTYLTRGMSWKADYILFLDDKDLFASIDCWSTINNNSGVSYKDSKVRIIAGDVRQEAPRAMKTARYAMDMAAAPAFNEAAGEKPFFEYHIYDVPGNITLANNKSVQAKLFSSKNISVKKEFEARSTYSYYTRSYNKEGTPVPVNVTMNFRNDKKNNLGIPFPGGVIRVYKKDAQNNAGFIGEDRITNTSEEEELKIELGTAFDIKVEKKQTDYKQLSKNLYESAWEVTLRNNKDNDVVVNVIETLQGNWTVIDESMSYEKIDAYRIKFAIKVSAGKESKVSYRVKVGI